MPRYRYHHLQVSCYKPKKFHPQDLRKAVEYLKTIEQGPLVGITVKSHVRAGRFRIDAPAFLKLDEIVGKRPSEAWELLDQQIDAQIAYFKRRAGAFKP